MCRKPINRLSVGNLMGRIVKRPDIRKKEFIQTAKELFLLKGYEDTSVEEIINKMGVAKGCFYHYFTSKEELLMAVIDESLLDLESAVNKILNEKNIDATQRLGRIFEATIMWRRSYQGLADYFHRQSNRYIHYEIEKKGTELMIPVLEQIILQGKKEGIFETRYPREAAIAYLSTLNALSGTISSNEQETYTQEKEKILEHFSEQILMAKPRTFQFYAKYI